ELGWRGHLVGVFLGEELRVRRGDRGPRDVRRRARREVDGGLQRRVGGALRRPGERELQLRAEGEFLAAADLEAVGQRRDLTRRADRFPAHRGFLAGGRVQGELV